MTPCRSAFLSESLEVASGRTASLTPERLNSMIEGYYRARGLDVDGEPTSAQLDDLRIDVLVP